MAVFDNSLHVTWAGEACSGPPDSSVNGSTWPSQPHRTPHPPFSWGSSPLLSPGREVDSWSYLCIPEVTPVPGSRLEDNHDLVIWLNVPKNDPGALSNALPGDPDSEDWRWLWSSAHLTNTLSGSNAVAHSQDATFRAASLQSPVCQLPKDPRSQAWRLA